MKNLSDSLDEVIDLVRQLDAKLDSVINKYSEPTRIEGWEHYCQAENTKIWTEKGCECNWCGKTEQDTAEFGKLGDPIEL